jgi:hypothetical protein
MLFRGIGSFVGWRNRVSSERAMAQYAFAVLVFRGDRAGVAQDQSPLAVLAWTIVSGEPDW